METINRKTLAVYPNPTHGQVTLPAATASYSITTMAGQQVLRGESNIANLGELGAGIYTIRAVLQDGTISFGKISKL